MDIYVMLNVVKHLINIIISLFGTGPHQLVVSLRMT